MDVVVVIGCVCVASLVSFAFFFGQRIYKTIHIYQTPHPLCVGSWIRNALSRHILPRESRPLLML
jgi:hypothetical protein